jgi:hypothetical protein
MRVSSPASFVIAGAVVAGPTGRRHRVGKIKHLCLNFSFYVFKHPF